MRPQKMTEAHQTGDVAELVCSNSLKSGEPENAHGLLKAELRVLGSVLLECAERARVPGGKALVVDRRRFSAEVQSELSRAGVSIERAEVSSLPSAVGWYRSRVELSDPHQPTVDLGELGTVLRAENRGQSPGGSRGTLAGTVPVFGPAGAGVTVVATGPLTSSPMAESLQAMLGTEHLFFYDAIAPIVSAESLDMTRIFEGSRYGAGSDYLNCPMTEEEYDRFVTALLGAELHPLHDFENREGEHPQISQITQMSGQRLRSPQQEPGTRNEEPGTFFEGCLPVEEIARRGKLALAFGPMKPVGLVDTRPDRLGTRAESADTGEKWGQSPGARRRAVQSPFFAVVQLRRENADGTMYNLVGFQTRLKQGDQERVFRMIPGLEKVTFLRFGSIHRNTFLDSPKMLLPTLQTRVGPDLLVAGQLTGVEGYVESIGAGLVAGINAARLARGDEPVELPREMMLGGLLRYVTSPTDNFQPMNANLGLLPPLEKRLRGRDKRRALAERALEAARGFALTVADSRA